MKNLLVLFLSVLFISNLSSQVRERSNSMSLGSQNSFMIDLEGAERKMSEKLFKSFFKEYGKVQKNKKAKEWYMTGAQISLISSEPLDIYAKFDEARDYTTMTFWVDNGSAFMSSDEFPRQYRSIEQLLNDFRIDVRKEVIKKELKAEEKRLKGFEKDLSKLEKKNQGYHKDIDKANAAIVKAENNIIQNLKDQEDKKSQIEKQKELVQQVIERLNNVGNE